MSRTTAREAAAESETTTGPNDEAKTKQDVYPTRRGRRDNAAAYVDPDVGLRVLKPKEPGATGPAGAWRYTYTHPVTGKRAPGRFYGTRDEVVRQAKQLVKDLERGDTGDWRDITFAQVTDAYLADPSHRWNPRTRRNQTDRVTTLRNETALGTATLGQLVRSPKFMTDELAKLARTIRPKTKRPYAQSTLQLIHGTLGTLLSYAQEAEMLPYEYAPMRRVKIPKVAPGAKGTGIDDEDHVDDGSGRVPDAEIPSMAAAERLAEVWVDRAVGSPWWRGLAIMVAALAGLRWSEVHALRPRDLVLTGPKRRIHVSRAILHDANGKPIGWAKPKGKDGGKRRIALLPPPLVEPLARRCAELPSRDALLFPSPRDPNRPYLYKSFRESFERFAKAAGWPVDEHGLLRWTFHSLRHLGCVTQLRDVGIDPAMVSEAAGHSSVAFTLERYVGTTEDSRELANQQMDAHWS